MGTDRAKITDPAAEAAQAGGVPVAVAGVRLERDAKAARPRAGCEPAKDRHQSGLEHGALRGLD